MPVTVTRHGDSAGDLAAAALARNSHGDGRNSSHSHSSSSAARSQSFPSHDLNPSSDSDRDS